jgi:hypothetical protein
MARAGRVDRAEVCLRELERRHTRGSENGFWIAVLLGALGRIDQAFAWLDRAIDQRDSNLLFITILPDHVGLREDPRFTGILARLGLEHWVPRLCRREGAPHSAADPCGRSAE